MFSDVLFSFFGVVTQLVSPAAAANLDPRPWWHVSTQLSSERVYVTLLSYFLDFPDLAPLLCVRARLGRETVA